MYKNLDIKPTIRIAKATDKNYVKYISDSIKIGFKYALKFNIIGEGNIAARAEVNFKKDSVIITKNNVNIINVTEGMFVASFIARDLYGLTDTAQLNIFVFKNLPPVAVFNVETTKKLSQYEISVDATASFDKDSKWGGRVVNYRYRIGSNYDVTNNLNKISYIFGSPGSKNVSVSVQDNEGAWSEEVTSPILITK
jgi:hypothetical protein